MPITKRKENNMNNKDVRWTAAFLAALMMVPASSWAFGGGRGEGRMGPPSEAIEACKGKTEGTEVEFSSRRGDKVKATCRMMPVPEGFAGEDGPMGKDLMAKKLGLNDSQKEKINALLKTEQEKSAPLRQQIEESRDQLRKTSLATPFNETAVQAVAAKIAKLKTEMMVSRARVKSEIYALLTTEQRAQAEKLRLPRGPRYGQHMPHFGWED